MTPEFRSGKPACGFPFPTYCIRAVNPITPPIRVQRETILRGKSRITVFAEINTKVTSMHKAVGVLMGTNLGLTFNNIILTIIYIG